MGENIYIIIPTYNERDNIEGLILEIFSKISNINILVVDDNSPDGTAQVIRRLQKTYSKLNLLEQPIKNGLGGAYVAGFRYVLKNNSVKRVITMDADFSHSPRYLPSLLEACGDGNLVIGSRYVPGGGITKWELWRRILSRCANLYVQLVLQKPVRDWTAGFNCIDANLLRKVNLAEIDLSGYAFLQELKYLLIQNGAWVREIPIIFEERRGGKSKISGFIIREGIIGPWKIRGKK